MLPFACFDIQYPRDDNSTYLGNNEKVEGTKPISYVPLGTIVYLQHARIDVTVKSKLTFCGKHYLDGDNL